MPTLDTAWLLDILERVIDSPPNPHTILVNDDDRAKAREWLSRVRAANPPTAPEPIYRFLRIGDVIQLGDESISRSGATWEPVPQIFLGSEISVHFSRNIRRRVAPITAIDESREANQLRARIKNLRAALQPFKQVADTEERAPEGETVMVNVSRCREARDALAADATDVPASNALPAGRITAAEMKALAEIHARPHESGTFWRDVGIYPATLDALRAKGLILEQPKSGSDEATGSYWRITDAGKSCLPDA